MSQKFWIIVIVAVAVLLVVLMLRRQLKRLTLRGPGMAAEVETYGTENASRAATESVAKRASVSIKNNKQVGSGNAIDVGRGDVEIEGNTQQDENQIIVRPDQRNQE